MTKLSYEERTKLRKRIAAEKLRRVQARDEEERRDEIETARIIAPTADASPPSWETRELLDQDYTVGDFFRDLDRVTRRIDR